MNPSSRAPGWLVASTPAPRAQLRPSPATARLELVITGDDLGLRSDWDAAIFEAFRHGVLTSTSVVTNGPTYDAAARALREDGFDCGVHLNLIHGAPLSPAAEVPSLVDIRGRFPGSFWRVFARYARGKLRTREIALEWERQVRRALDDGLRPSHLNAHYHLHALPGLFRLAVELARRFGIRWVRVPDEPPWHARGAVAWSRAGTLWLLARRNWMVHGGDGVGLIPCRGIAANGALGLAAWHVLLDRIGRQSPGRFAIEVMCHPGQGIEQTAALVSRELADELGARALPRTFRQLGSAHSAVSVPMRALRPVLAVIPAFNEEANIGGVLDELQAAGVDCDVFVVDDGSCDRTADLARAGGATVISHPKNRGYGAALVSGYAHALAQGYDIVVQLDGDGQHDPAQVTVLLEALRAGDADMVLGSRMLQGGGHVTSLPRKLGIHFFAWLGRWLIARPITDPTSGFSAMNRRVVEFLAQNTPNDYPDLNVLVALHRAGIQVVEVPMVMRPRRAGQSQMRGLAPFIYLPKMLIYLWQVYRTARANPGSNHPAGRPRR